jgi:hypothetical protein
MDDDDATRLKDLLHGIEEWESELIAVHCTLFFSLDLHGGSDIQSPFPANK